MIVFVLMLNDTVLGVYTTEELARNASIKHWKYHSAYGLFKSSIPEDNGYFYRVYDYPLVSEEYNEE